MDQRTGLDKAEEAAALAARPAERVQALDLLRGLAVMGMIMVAYAGDWNHRFSVLTHADWRGFALADMIFPGFLFCAGAALPYSLRSRAARRPDRAGLLGYVLWRALALVLLGVLLNAVSGWQAGPIRLMGILQRIGLCYAAAGVVCVLLGRRGKDGFTLALAPLAAIAILVLAGYGALLLAWDAPGCGRACFDSSHSLPTVIDRAVFGVAHLWPYGTTDGVVTYEPEGLLSTLGASFDLLVGVMAAVFVQRQGVRRALPALAAAGAACLAAGWALDPLLPVVKKIWTPSFALLSGGFALLAFVLLAWLDPAPRARWTVPMRVFGANATLAFVGVTLADTLLQLPLSHRNLHDTAADALGRLIPDARIASATYSALLMAALGCGLWMLYRRRVFFRIRTPDPASR